MFEVFFLTMSEIPEKLQMRITVKFAKLDTKFIA